MAIASGAREAEGAFLSVQGSRQSASLLEEREEVRWGARSEGVPGALMFLVTSARPQPQRHEQVKPSHFQEDDTQPDYEQVVEV